MPQAERSFARATIPAGTAAEVCPHCEMTVFHVHLGGAKLPFDVQGDGCYRPSRPTAAIPRDGEGIEHVPRCRGRRY